MTSTKQNLASPCEDMSSPIWIQTGKPADENKILDLGLGCPDYSPPHYVQEALKQAVLSEDPFIHQYVRSNGHPRLVNALSQTFSPIYGRVINPMKEILITVGAYQSLFYCAQGFINPGDEVIIIEPYFPCFETMVNRAGGTPVFIPLKRVISKMGSSSKDWKLDPEELASKFNSKTKLIFLNNPNNPTGKVFSKEELELIAGLCKKHDVICISDEIYEGLIYDENRHIKIATLSGMWDRTITIGSFGKMFGVTGWRVGWSIGPAHLIKALSVVHLNCCESCPTFFQEAGAMVFESELARYGQSDSHIQTLAAEFQSKRDLIAKRFQETGLTPIVPEAGYFIIADFSKLEMKFDDSEFEKDDSNDVKFVKWLKCHKKLKTIPVSVFYSAEHKHLAKNLVRFCFVKDATIHQAMDILKEGHVPHE